MKSDNVGGNENESVDMDNVNNKNEDVDENNGNKSGNLASNDGSESGNIGSDNNETKSVDVNEDINGNKDFAKLSTLEAVNG